MRRVLTHLVLCPLLALMIGSVGAQPAATGQVAQPPAGGAAPPQPPVAAAVQGIIVDITKDETTPTGSITVAVKPANLNYSFYEGSYLSLPNFNTLKPKYTGQMYGFDISLSQDHDNFAMFFSGFLKIDIAGTYNFYLTSDDGSQLLIDDKLIVNNDGLHPPTLVTGSATLTKGMHKLNVGYFQHFGGTHCNCSSTGPA